MDRAMAPGSIDLTLDLSSSRIRMDALGHRFHWGKNHVEGKIMSREKSRIFLLAMLAWFGARFNHKSYHWRAARDHVPNSMTENPIKGKKQVGTKKFSLNKLPGSGDLDVWSLPPFRNLTTGLVKVARACALIPQPKSYQEEKIWKGKIFFASYTQLIGF